MSSAEGVPRGESQENRECSSDEASDHAVSAHAPATDVAVVVRAVIFEHVFECFDDLCLSRTRSRRITAGDGCLEDVGGSVEQNGTHYLFLKSQAVIDGRDCDRRRVRPAAILVGVDVSHLGQATCRS